MIMNQKKNINEYNNHNNNNNNKNHNSGNNNNNSNFNIIPSSSSNSNSNSNSNKFNNFPYHNSIPNRTRNNSYKQSHQFERPIFKKPLLKTVRSSLNNSNLQNNFNTKYTQNITNDNSGFNPINQNQLQYQNQFNSDSNNNYNYTNQLHQQQNQHLNAIRSHNNTTATDNLYNNSNNNTNRINSNLLRLQRMLLDKLNENNNSNNLLSDSPLLNSNLRLDSSFFSTNLTSLQNELSAASPQMMTHNNSITHNNNSPSFQFNENSSTSGSSTDYISESFPHTPSNYIAGFNFNRDGDSNQFMGNQNNTFNMNLNQMKYLTNNVNFVSSTSSSSASSSAADLFELPSNFYSISNSSTSSATSPLFNETQVMETSIPPYTKFNNTQMNSVFNTPSDIASNDFQDLNSHNNNTNNNNNSVTDNETSSWDDVLINDSEIKFESKNYELPRLPSQRQLTNRKFNSAPAINTISSQSTTVNDTIKHLPLDFELGIDYNFDHDSGNSNQLINFETFIDLHNKNNSFSAVENKLTANNATKTPISTSPLTSTTTEKASGNKRRRNSDKRSKSVVEATIYEEALAAGNDEDADNSDDNQQNNNNSKSNIDDLEMHESMDGSNSPNNKRISDARLSLVELAKVLKLEHDVKETALRERNILAVLKEDLGFELGLRTWIRDTPSAERLKLMGELCKLVEDKYHYGYGKSTLETIVRRASYYLMQGRLRRERRAARKRKLISSKQQQLLKSNTDESASSSTTSPSV